MRAAVLIGALCAIGTMGSPIEKRVYETDLSVVTVTSTVTGGEQVATVVPAPAPAPAPVEQKQAAEPAPQEQATTITSAYEYTVTSAPETSATEVDPVATSAPAPEPTTTTAAPQPATTSSSSEVTTAPAPTTSSTTSAAPSTSADSQSSTGEEYQAQILQNHNMHRSNHSAPALAWSTDLESTAQQLADGCVYQHNTQIGGGGYGQNIGYGIPASDIGKMITNLMYNDEFDYFNNLYGEANPDMTNFEKWGHFSQIVWKGTKQVGCYTKVCSSLQNVDSDGPLPFTVCNYSPAGNFEGEYNTNIEKPLGHAFYAVA
ncbi:SCP-like extracellular protein [Paecilomyces variotii No. 5]|uniref:SCP-like extracellular protein n=1 Tax=Byssochlamys spectabilis (strain No. 5 / NBRC 109023) TaxID=1356009 RepID=V5HYI4_BYSSN|nr:SCP-like extracellular protein [Paecilomyces variotii No. 5]